MLELNPGSPPVLAGRFEIVGIIDDSGSMRMYLAWDATDERWVCVRMPSFRAARDTLVRSRFEREVRTHRKLQHPNILQVIVADAAHPRFPWAATDVAEGGSISDWMSQHGVLPAYLAIDVMADVCSGLSAAHRAGVSHGALKANQVLINRHGKCVVSGLVGGGERGDVQADVKGAGALLYTLLTGRAWDDKRAASLVGALPPVIGRVVERARQGRGGYADVSTFSRDLEAAVLSLPTPSGAVPPLAGPDVVLPGDPAQLFDPQAKFPDLEHVAKALEDPEYQPPADYRDRPVVEETVASASPGTTAPTGAVESDGRSAAVPYQMSRGVSNAADFNPEMYSRGDKPLYEEPPPKDKKEEWTYDPNEHEAKKPEPKAEEKPFLSDATLVKLLFVAAALFALSIFAAVGYGARAVGESRVPAEQAASALVEHVRGESELVYAMARAGADRKTLEDAYFEYTEARNDTVRVQKAMAFAAVVRQQAQAHRLDSISQGGAVTPLTERVDEMGRRNSELLAKRRAWEQSASGFPGVLAVVIGIQMGPPW